MTDEVKRRLKRECPHSTPPHTTPPIDEPRFAPRFVRLGGQRAMFWGGVPTKAWVGGPARPPSPALARIGSTCGDAAGPGGM
ncbi:unnamed protein product [Lampetra fluviatilis]